MNETIKKLEDELYHIKLENKKLHRDVYTLNQHLAQANAQANIKLSNRIRIALFKRLKNLLSRLPILYTFVRYLNKYLTKPKPFLDSPFMPWVEQDKTSRSDQNPKRLVFISPLPPARSGIADYSLALLEDLDRIYDLVVVCENEAVMLNPSLQKFKMITAQEYYKIGNIFDRHLYHFGNSFYHLWMKPLVERFPGILVLHDVFLGGYTHASLKDQGLTAVVREVFKEEGYEALSLYMRTDIHQTLLHYPLNKSLISQSDGVIVHSEYALSLLDISEKVMKVPFPKKLPSITMTQEDAKIALGLAPETFLVCSFGFIGATKCSKELIEAWTYCAFDENAKNQLTFVGALPQTPYGEALKSLACEKNITFTGYCDEVLYKTYLIAADVVVQLRQNSRGESSAALFDALSYAKPVILNANGSFNEVPHHVALMLSDSFTISELAHSLQILSKNKEKRKALSVCAHEYISSFHQPIHTVQAYQNAIEMIYQNGRYASYREALNDEHISLEKLCQLRMPTKTKRLYVDVSDVAHNDLRTGIQRVVRSVLHAMMSKQDVSYRIEPIRLVEGRYVHAHNFTCKFLGLPFSPLVDEPVHMAQGDIFLGLDLYVGHIGANSHIFEEMQKNGVQIWFVVYDILPVLFPHYFPQPTAPQFQKWLEVVTTYAQGVACISKAVAQDVEKWLKTSSVQRDTPLEIKAFPLGADISNSHPTKGISTEEKELLAKLSSQTIGMMVGTVEPRKGHAYALAAFEVLWEKNIECLLVIVGKKGWMVEEVAHKLTQHPELNKKLFWFENASDELLEKLYEKATFLLAASEAEGYGLPLVEAAKHALPIIARDIPVFREVASSHAHYFPNIKEPVSLADEITNWLHLYTDNKHPKSEGMKTIHWEESSEALKTILKPSKQLL